MMRAERTIRTGIIGYGLSGRIFHSPFLTADPRFSLDVIATSDPERQRQARQQHSGAEIVATPGELIERQLDLVVVASPAHAHLDQGLAAIASGAAVIIDKPFAPSVADAEQLIAAADFAGTALTVYQNRRFDGDFLTVRKLLADGAFGDVHRFESTFERWSPALRDRWQDTTPTSDGAGITFDLGSHLIDQALQLFGPAKLEHAELSILRHGGVSDDEAFLSLRHGSGVRSHLTLSRLAAQSGPRFRVLGSASGYRVDGLDNQEPALMAGGRPDDPGFGQVPEAEWGTLGLAGLLTHVPTERGRYVDFYSIVASALLDGESLPVEAADALETVRIITRAHDIAGF